MSTPRSAGDAPPRDAAEHDHLVERFNAAVRHPGEHGGVGQLARLLDALAQSEGERWIVDGNARLSMTALVRYCYPQPEIHVVAAEYGDAAHRRGWLRLDRALGADDYGSLLGSVDDWAKRNRTLDQVLDAYGPPSVVFGDPGPRTAKTLGYGSEDREAPLLAFHFGDGKGAAQARLLAFRSGDDLFEAYMGFTPHGETVADEKEGRQL
ncbi:hypothetical protein [Kitasatospora sp. NPDC101183]|uniref:hypothetical protein n=1 Tax=Kitasatospora sp. NPDC101183 TaxID=3364100 RepID=UPI003829474A